MFQQLMVIPMSIYANRHTFLDDPFLLHKVMM